MLHKASFISLCLLALVGCKEQDDLLSGKVVAKEHEPVHTWVQMIPIYSKVGDVTTTINMPMIHTDDEDFVVVVDGVTLKGKSVTIRYYARDKFDWENVRIGEIYEDGRTEVSMVRLSKVDTVTKTHAKTGNAE